MLIVSQWDHGFVRDPQEVVLETVGVNEHYIRVNHHIFGTFTDYEAGRNEILRIFAAQCEDRQFYKVGCQT